MRRMLNLLFALIMAASLAMTTSCTSPFEGEQQGPAPAATTPTDGSVSIRTTPAADTIKVDGRVLAQGAQLVNYPMPEGSHVYEAILNGHKTLVALFGVKVGENTSFELTFEKIMSNMGQVVVYTLPGQPAAEVVLTGRQQFTGQTPFDKVVEQGEYSLVVKRDGYEQFQVNFNLPGGGVKSVLADLKAVGGPRWIGTRVRPSKITLPVGTSFRLIPEKLWDNQTATPATQASFSSTNPMVAVVDQLGLVTPNSSGEVEIEIAVDTALVRTKVTVVRQELSDGTVTFIFDEPLIGSIIRRDASGVLLDSVFTGVRIYTLPLGKFVFELGAPGYKSRYEVATIDPGTDLQFRVSLQKGVSTDLAITSGVEFPGAFVEVIEPNRTLTGTTPAFFSLEPGLKVVRVFYEGRKPFEEIVTLNLGDKKGVRAELPSQDATKGNLAYLLRPQQTVTDVYLLDGRGSRIMQGLSAARVIYDLAPGIYYLGNGGTVLADSLFMVEIFAGKTTKLEKTIGPRPASIGYYAPIVVNTTYAGVVIWDKDGKPVDIGNRTTGTSIPLRIDGNPYSVLITKHGFEPVQDVIEVGQVLNRKEYTLKDISPGPGDGWILLVSNKTPGFEIRDQFNNLVSVTQNFTPAIVRVPAQPYPGGLPYTVKAFWNNADLQAPAVVFSGRTTVVNLQFQEAPVIPPCPPARLSATIAPEVVWPNEPVTLIWASVGLDSLWGDHGFGRLTPIEGGSLTFTPPGTGEMTLTGRSACDHSVLVRVTVHWRVDP